MGLIVSDARDDTKSKILLRWKNTEALDQMTDEYGIRKGIDTDYINVENKRADVSESNEVAEDDNMERQSRTSQNADTDMSHLFDVERGSGAASEVDELIDQNAVIDHDGRASTRTFFYIGEAPSRNRKQFKRMLRWQEGEGSKDRKQQNSRAYQHRWASTFCSALDMSDYQHSRVEHIIDEIDMSHMAHYSSEEVILGIITIVANEDNRFIRDEDGFRTLVSDVGTDLRTMRKVRNLLRDKADSV